MIYIYNTRTKQLVGQGSIRELARIYKRDRDTIKRNLDKVDALLKEHIFSSIPLYNDTGNKIEPIVSIAKEDVKEDISFIQTKLDLKRVREENSRLRVNEKVYIDEIEGLVRTSNFISDLKGLGYRDILVPTDPSRKNQATAIALLSDVHIEERVDSNSVGGLNETNPDIMEYRVKTFFSKVVSISKMIKQTYDLREITIALLGDGITGSIHEELAEENYMTSLEASHLYQSLIISGLKYLSENGGFDTINVIFMFGNHGRLGKAYRFSSWHINNLEWYVAVNIADVFRNAPGYENIKLDIADARIIQRQILGYTIRFCHGDHFKYRGGVGGVEIPLKTWLYKQDKITPAYLTVMGHWHSYLIGSNFVVNGSVRGVNAHEFDHGWYEEPSQAYLLIDRDKGFIDAQKIILK